MDPTPFGPLACIWRTLTLNPQSNVGQITDALDVKNDPSAALSKRQEDTKETKDGNNVVTTSKSEGTTNNKLGYSWHAAQLGDSLVKRQGGEDTKEVKDGNKMVTISKSEGVTDDKTGYSWRAAQLLE